MSGSLLQRFIRWFPRWKQNEYQPPLPFFERNPQTYIKDQHEYRESAAGYRTGTRPIWWRGDSTHWQARLWLGRENGGPISLGLYQSEREAHAIWLAVSKRLAARGMPDPLPLTAWEELLQVPNAKSGTLPRWVYRDGKQYRARAVIRGTMYETGSKRTPRAAFLALWSVIKPIFPARKPEPRDKAVMTGKGLFDAAW